MEPTFYFSGVEIDKKIEFIIYEVVICAKEKEKAGRECDFI